MTIFFSAHVQCTFAKVAEKFLMKKQQKISIWNVSQKKVSSERSCCKSQTQFWQPWPINVVKTPQLAPWIVGKSYILYKLSEKFVPIFFHFWIGRMRFSPHFWFFCRSKSFGSGEVRQFLYSKLSYKNLKIVFFRPNFFSSCEWRFYLYRCVQCA